MRPDVTNRKEIVVMEDVTRLTTRVTDHPLEVMWK